MEQMVKQARELGQDISGMDCVYKTSLIGSTAFGRGLAPDQISCEGLERATAFRISAAHQKGCELKLVARTRRKGGAVEASVQLVALPPDHPLYGCRREANRLVVETATGRKVVVDGKGAGRWPTTVSVVSDILDRHRGRMAGAGNERTAFCVGADGS